jgi:hypothetical protein
MKYEQYAHEAHKFVSEIAIELGNRKTLIRRTE